MEKKYTSEVMQFPILQTKNLMPNWRLPFSEMFIAYLNDSINLTNSNRFLNL